MAAVASVARRAFVNTGRRSVAPALTRTIRTSSLVRAEPDSFAALDAQAPPPPRTLGAKATGPSNPASFNQAGASSPTIAEEIDPALADGTTDWSRSFSGLSQEAFTKEVAAILLAPLDPLDVEIKPDGIIYLPEIKYRRILNRAFGPGGWGLAPRSASTITARSVSREYALVCLGRLVSLARGEQDYFSGPEGIPTAAEGCRSNALMRCCKDLGVASELWDPNYINWWKKTYASQDWVVGAMGKKKQSWTKKRSAEWKPDFLRK